MINWDVFFKKVKDAVKKYEDELVVPKYREPFQILVSALISVRTKEEVTREVSEKLFRKIKSWEDIINMSSDELSNLLKPAGFYKRKAEYLKKIAKIIVEKYNGKIPDRYEDLINLPGVGNKVVKAVLVLVYNKDYIIVDTHVHRIFNRLGFIKTKSPEETEEELYKIVPRKYWRILNFLFVLFGRHICLPRNPKCEICPIKEYCKYYKEKVLKEN